MEYTKLRRAFFKRLAPDFQLCQLFDLLPNVSFFVKDRQGRFMALNQRGWEYCGVGSEEAAIGRTDHDFFPKSRADEYRADDLSVIRSGDAILNRLESAPEPAGSPRLVVTSKIPLRDARGRVIGIAGFSRQVDQARESARAVDDFAKVIEVMHERYAESLSSRQLAEMAKLSVSQFERRFRRVMGSSPQQYLLRVRVEHGARRLRETNDSVTDIALSCGFYDHAHFSRTFRRLMKLSPREYRLNGA